MQISRSILNSTLSKLGVIVLSIVLLTGISLPTLQIGVQGQVQQPHHHQLLHPLELFHRHHELLLHQLWMEQAGVLNHTSEGEAANQTGGDGAVNQSANLFWILPMVKRWRRMWYCVGIRGTVVLMIVYLITRVPNPITNGRALPVNEIGIYT
jgi:hypothetical protein